MEKGLRRITTVGVLSAVSVVLAYLVRFPIFPTSAPWLEYEPADVSIMLTAFLFGPWWGLLTTFVVCALQAMTVSVQSGIIGFAMHMFATGAFVIVSGLLYRREKTYKGAAKALICGMILTVALMAPLNLIFTPLRGTPVQAVKDMMFPIILPFNLIKFGINSLLTFLLFNKLEKLLNHIWGDT